MFLTSSSFTREKRCPARSRKVQRWKRDDVVPRTTNRWENGTAFFRGWMTVDPRRVARVVVHRSRGEERYRVESLSVHWRSSGLWDTFHGQHICCTISFTACRERCLCKLRNDEDFSVDFCNIIIQHTVIYSFILLQVRNTRLFCR